MLFGIIMLVLVAAVAFFHYVQGLFTAMTSCVLAILAAMIALAHHEPVAESLLARAMPAQAHAIVLVALFSLSYVVMRVAADKLVPGNVRFNVMVDKIGAGVFGVLAACFGVGVLAIAAQLLPFGPSIAGYSRYALADRSDFTVKNLPRQLYYTKLGAWNELERDRYDSASASGMFPLPIDSMVLGLASYVSAGGSLAGVRSFAQVHPDYSNELFGTRLAQPFNGGDVLFSVGTAPGLTVSQVYTSKAVLDNPEDIESKVVRGEHSVTVTSEGDTVPLVIRVAIAAAKGTVVATPAAVRLAISGKDGSRDYYPIGSYQRGERLLLFRPDDPICIDPGQSVDFVFMVESENLVRSGASDSEIHLPRGTFIEANRSARADLSGREIAQSSPGGGENVGVLDKKKP
jgi:hypothetical protein